MDRVVSLVVVVVELGTHCFSWSGDSLHSAVLGAGMAGMLGLFRVVDRRIANVFRT